MSDKTVLLHDLLASPSVLGDYQRNFLAQVLAASDPSRPTAITIMKSRNMGKSRFDEIAKRIFEVERADQLLRIERLQKLVTFLSARAKAAHTRPASLRAHSLVAAAYSFGIVLEPMNLGGLPVQFLELPVKQDGQIPADLVAIFDRDQRMIGAFNLFTPGKSQGRRR
jgi:hypothetical protein